MMEYGKKAPQTDKKRFPVVTLCGSTRFKDKFEEAAAKLSLRGYVVLSLGVFDKSGDAERYGVDEDDCRLMEQLGDMHKQRIEMSDAIYVVNPGGYVGKATKGEIAYARSLGKDVLWLEELSVGDVTVSESGEVVYSEVA